MAARKPKKTDTARKLAIDAAKLASERNCEGIAVLDLRKVSPVADYFVICTGTSDRQMRSVAEEIAEHGKSLGQKVWRTAGAESGQWIVLDFVDVVVHLFDQPHRRYYDLELIWGDAARVQWARPGDSARAADKGGG